MNMNNITFGAIPSPKDIRDYRIACVSNAEFPVEYELKHVLTELVNMIEKRAADKGLELQVEVYPELPSKLYGDDVRIKQIVTNLLTNDYSIAVTPLLSGKHGIGKSQVAKSIAKDIPENFAMFSAPFINFLIYLLMPLNFIFSQWKKLISKLFKTEDNAKMSQEELLMFVEEVQQEGSIDDNSGELIRSAIEFRDLKAEEILKDKAQERSDMKPYMNTANCAS